MFLTRNTNLGTTCPEYLNAEYDKHITDGANRIMEMAEKQQSHRIEIEKLVVESQQRQSGRGQIFALIIGISGIGAGTFLAANGHDYVGGIIAGSTVVGLVYAFITGRRKQFPVNKE